MGSNYSQLMTRKKVAGCVALVLVLRWLKGSKPVTIHIMDQLMAWKVSSLNKGNLAERAAKLPGAPPKSLGSAAAPSPELVAFMELMLSSKTTKPMTLKSWRSVLPSLRYLIGEGPELLTPVNASVPSYWVTWPGVSVDSPAALLYFHGGGYIAGHPEHYRGWIGEYSKALSLPVLAVEYRLAPEHSIEDAVQDGVNAYEWLLSKDYKVIISGDSAGGGLMLLVMQKLGKLGRKLPACCVAISPFCDLSMSGKSNLENSERDMLITAATQATIHSVLSSCIPDLKDPSVSALFGSFAKLPPMLILVGESECLRDDSTRLAENAKEVGVDVTLHVEPHVGHDFPCFCKTLPEGRDAVNVISSFVKPFVEG